MYFWSPVQHTWFYEYIWDKIGQRACQTEITCIFGQGTFSDPKEPFEATKEQIMSDLKIK